MLFLSYYRITLHILVFYLRQKDQFYFVICTNKLSVYRKNYNFKMFITCSKNKISKKMLLRALDIIFTFKFHIPLQY